MAIYPYKKANGEKRYLVRYYDADRKKQSARFDTKNEAKDFEANLRVAKRGGTRVKRQSTQTLKAFWAEYIETFAKADLQAATLDTYQRVWAKWIEPELGSVPLASLSDSPELVQKLKLKMIKAGASPDLQTKALTTLSAVCQKAVELQRMASNPCRVVKRPHINRQRPKVPDAAAVRDLLAAFTNTKDRLLAALIAYAGLRPGEALALHKSDIGAKAISVTKAIKIDGEGSTKTRSHRTVPIRDGLRPFLEGLEDGPLFVGERSGKQWTNLGYRNWRKRKFQTACAKVGLGMITEDDDGSRSYVGLTPYRLRNFDLTNLAIEHDPVMGAKIAGNSPKVFLDTYAEVFANRDDFVGSQMGPNTAPETQSAQ